MAPRQLTIRIDSAGLTALAAAGQRVALVKSSTNSAYAVIWQAVSPVGTIVIGWDGGYQVYESTTPIQPEERIGYGSTAVAVTGYTYPFAGGQFGAGAAGLGPSEVGIRNNDPQVIMAGVAMFTGGLGQAATVNDQPATGPLDAQAVLSGEVSVSTVSELVLVFPAGGVATGTVLERSWLSGDTRAAVVLGQPLPVDLSTVTSQTVSYDDQANRFVSGPA
jgi:hypothetical protein